MALLLNFAFGYFFCVDLADFFSAKILTSLLSNQQNKQDQKSESDPVETEYAEIMFLNVIDNPVNRGKCHQKRHEHGR